MNSWVAWAKAGCLLAGLTMLTACGLGPATMRFNRLDYNVTAQRSNSEQLLLNLVRMKYLETPLFMQVGTIASSFSYSVSAGASLATNPATQQFPLGTAVSESPTVTYTPMDGQKYTQEILAEIDSQRFLMLFRANTNIEILLHCVLDRIGRLENQAPNRPMNLQKLQDFVTFCRLARQMQITRDLDILQVAPEDGAKEADKGKKDGKKKDKPKPKDTSKDKEKDKDNEADKDKNPSLLMVMRFPGSAQAREMATLLGVPYRPSRNKAGQEILAFRMVEGSLLEPPLGGSQRYVDLPVRMRSLREVLDYLGQGVEVPHEDRSFTAVGLVPSDGAAELVDPYPYVKDYFRVRRSASKPEGAMVMVPYRDGWYYISDSDLGSKLVFSFLSTLLALQSGNPPAHAPLLTLPVGG
jgi:hypothetical protein